MSAAFQLTELPAHEPASTNPGHALNGRPAGTLTRFEADEHQLGRHHFHWLRAVLEGLPPGQSWNRYLAFAGTGYSARLHPTRLGKLLGRVQRAAGQRGLGDLATIALDRARFRAASADAPDTVAAAAPAEQGLPDLDTWIDEQVRAEAATNPGFDRDFYSEGEWLDLYTEAMEERESTVPPPSPTPLSALADLPEPEAQVRARCSLGQQLAALNELERALTQHPLPDDRIRAWLSESLCKRLEARGVLTLKDLVNLIELRGWCWHRSVPGVGSAIGRRVTAWVAERAVAFGTPLRQSAVTPPALRQLIRTSHQGLAPPKRFALVPLHRLAVPAHLSGVSGRFRSAGENTLGANTDLEAIMAWLQRHQDQPTTFGSYGRAVERFYLWCLHERRAPLSDITESDLLAYRTFLASPPPHWIARTVEDRESDEWRPFRKAQAPTSQRHAFTIIAALFAGLIDAGYLTANPARGVVPRMKLPPPRIDTRRSFTEAQWRLIEQTLAALPQTPFLRRNRLVLALAASTGLRRIELCTARMRDLRHEWVDGEQVWILEVEGKGGKRREAVIPDAVKALIDEHHRDMEEAQTAFEQKADEIRTLRGLQATDAVAAPGQDMRPLIGALKRPPAKWVLGSNGAAELDKEGRALSDQFGALESSALYQALKRLFKTVVKEVQKNGDLVDQADISAIASASTHWLRHFFANTAVADDVSPVALQQMLGHSSIATTAIYTKPERSVLVKEHRKLRSRA